MLSLILLIAAFIVLAVDAFGLAVGKVKLLSLGLALWVLSLLLAGKVF